MDQALEPTFLSRGIDYLEDLGAKLRDLKGFTTLANELLQNADDAHATEIVFHVTEEALVVDNNGVFSDCGAVESAQCPFRQTKNHMCDFHRFRLVGSGDKRRQEGTTGAFGFGFTAVYQITDRPEVLSAGRHWILREEKPEAERIVQCSGCERCRTPELPGTRFYLPWASDSDSPLRKALTVEAVRNEDQTALVESLLHTLPAAIMFLKNLSAVVVKERGKTRLELERTVEANRVLVSGGPEDMVWHLVHGSFEPEAKELRKKYPGLIEDKRSSTVMLAVPKGTIIHGRLCAYLPTEFTTGLQFHVNADFYPTRDRKNVRLATDFQGQWNRAAIAAAATALGDSLSDLRPELGHERLWEIINSTYEVHQQAKEGTPESILSEFWETLKVSLGSCPVFFTADKEWRNAQEVFLLLDKHEEQAIPLLTEMGIACLHPNLRPYFNLFRIQDVGVPFLDLETMVQAIEDAGLDERITKDALPDFLQAEERLQLLWDELSVLLSRKAKPERIAELRTRLSQCALAVGFDGALWPCAQLYRGDNRTQQVFQAIHPAVTFMKACGESESELEALCPEFSVRDAVEALERQETGTSDTEALFEPDISSILGWFENHREVILRDPDVKASIAALPIFPTAQGRKPLRELVLPGGFEDPLGLADVVDLSRPGVRRDFLRDLGAEELTFERYVLDHLPIAFEQEALDSDRLRAIVQLLAGKLGEFIDNFKIEDTLCDLPLVECVDGEFRKPGETYFDVADLEQLFSGKANEVRLPDQHEEAVRELYDWLGVQPGPRLNDIAERVKVLVAEPPTDGRVNIIRKVFAHLGQRFADDDQDEAAIAQLQDMAWLPGRGNRERWFKPSELHTVFLQYLFASQAVFLDVERNIQNDSATFLGLLGVESQPSSVKQVVEHLLWCSEKGKQVNNEVYRWLNDKAEAQSVEHLVGKACLLLPGGSYVRPDQVFWSEHPFGSFRYRLAKEMRSYDRFLDCLGVKEGPDHRDALAVIAEIEQKYAPGNLLVEEADLGILLSCWQILGQDLDRSVEDEDLAEEMRETLEGLSARKVIPDRRGLLCRPGWLLFEDRPGIAVKFQDTLGNNIIPRPQKAWLAMQLAGVRHLSDALRSELVECRDAREDSFVFERIQERRQELRRVFETRAELQTTSDGDDFLHQITCRVADEIVIQYGLEGFGGVPPSQPESVRAHYHRENHTLYSCQSNGSPPWTAIARELALALCPGSEPGGLAAGIKEVLAAEDPQMVNNVLDELGYPPVSEEVVTPGPTTEGPIQDFGGEKTVVDEPPGTPEDDAELVPEVGQSEGDTGDEGKAPDEEDTTTMEVVESILGPDARQPAPPPEELDTPDLPRGGGGTGVGTGGPRGTGTGGRRGPASNKGKLRTYVKPTTDGGTGQTGEAAGGRNPVDEAGIAHVIAFEAEQGRRPVEKHQTHPGYDIESFNGANEVERFIEVKSLSGTWSSLGAVLTDTQFEKAEQLGDKYWLYIVEHAQEDDYGIYRIQDPARKVNQFIFDDGWRALAEKDVAEQSGNEGSE